MSDYTPRAIEKPIDTIADGIPVAKERVLEWGKVAALDFINAGFEGKEQITSRKGTIGYFFTTWSKDGHAKYLPTAWVDIDMNTNSIIRFIGTYDQRVKVKDISEHDIFTNTLNTDEWNIDIKEAFDLAIKEIGEDQIFKYDNPKVVLRCGETFWDFAVYPSLDARAEEFLVKINPVTEEVISTEDKTKLQ